MLKKILLIICCFIPFVNIWTGWKGTEIFNARILWFILLILIPFGLLVVGLMWAIKQ